MEGMQMTGIDHETNESVTQASIWLRQQLVSPSPIVPHLRRRFGLSPREACQAISEASRPLAIAA
jgi:hypothetical protein